jgi:hypothetical protein
LRHKGLERKKDDEQKPDGVSPCHEKAPWTEDVLSSGLRKTLRVLYQDFWSGISLHFVD